MNETEKLERIMGIDFGLKRIGLALSDPLRIFAYPFTTLNNDKELLNNLNRIIKENNVVKIVLGYPLKESGLKASITDSVEKFKLQLEEKFNLEIICIDERYSSVIALRKITESVTKKSKRKSKELIDQNSAAVTLQDYLDKLR